jgi:hypothetical protein
LRDADREGRGNGGIDRGPTLSKNPRARLRGRIMGRNDHPEATDLGCGWRSQGDASTFCRDQENEEQSPLEDATRQITQFPSGFGR